MPRHRQTTSSSSGSRRVTTWLFWAFCVLLAWVLPAVARADDPAPDPVKDEARQLAYEGILALREERFADALASLRAAEEKFHAPTHLLYLARAHAGLGELIEAHDAYVALAIEPIPNYAAAPFHQARREAAAEVEQLRSRIATLQVAVAGGKGRQVSVFLDGHPVEPARLAHPIAVKPGEHRIEAVSGDGARTEVVAAVAVGQSKAVSLAVGLATVPPPGGEPTDPAGDSAPASGMTVTGAVLTAVGGAALVAGVITGGMTLQRARDIEETCGGDVCPTTEEGTVDDAKTLGNLSTVLVIAGGVVAATGVVLLVAAPNEDDPTRSTGTHVALGVAPFGVSLFGTF